MLKLPTNKVLSSPGSSEQLWQQVWLFMPESKAAMWYVCIIQKLGRTPHPTAKLRKYPMTRCLFVKSFALTHYLLDVGTRALAAPWINYCRCQINTQHDVILTVATQSDFCGHDPWTARQVYSTANCADVQVKSIYRIGTTVSTLKLCQCDPETVECVQSRSLTVDRHHVIGCWRAKLSPICCWKQCRGTVPLFTRRGAPAFSGVPRKPSRPCEYARKSLFVI